MISLLRVPYEVGQPEALDDLVARLPGPWTVTLGLTRIRDLHCSRR